MWRGRMGRSRRADRDPGNVVFGTIGWLFADLMFALAMAFLVATTVGQPPPRHHAVHTPKPTPSPSASPLPVLQLKPLKIMATINWTGLVAGEASAEAALQRRVQSYPGLRGRRAGLVLTFGGASGDGAGEAITIARSVDTVLQQLGTERFVFYGTVFRPFLSLSSPPDRIEIDVYLFKR
jgi:hypothetical protein